MRKTLYKISAMFILNLLFFSCASIGKKEPLVVQYFYDLKREDYNVVTEWYCIDVDADLYTDSYIVKKMNRHIFAKSNSYYKDRTGSQLIDMVRTKAVSPTSFNEAVQDKTIKSPPKKKRKNWCE